MRILLIDDDETNARFLQGLLTKAVRGPIAFEVTRTDRLFDALRQLDEAEDRIEAILLDLGLPECGGLTTLRLIRAHAPAVPVVVVTGLDSPDVEREAILAGAHDYLIKGQFGARRLEEALSAVAARERPRPEGPAQAELTGTFHRIDPD